MRTRQIIILALLASSAIPAVAEAPWYPSAYGPEDRLGAFNNLSAEGVRQAGALIKTGKVYEFFFVLAAPRFKGALQSVVHPIAIR